MSAKNRSVLMLPLKDVLPGDNPREEMNPTGISELMVSMRHQGLLQPIGVRVLDNGKYRIIYGHRRFMAAQKLGWDTIDAVEIDVVDEADSLMKTSSENVMRENVSLTEQGRVFNTLLKKGLTKEQIVAKMGCSKSFVEKAINSFSHVPARYRDKITFGTRGTMTKPGEIPATVALAAVDMKTRYKLTQDQVTQLMDWAAKHQVSTVKMRTAGALVDKGETVKEAIKQVEYMKHVVLSVTMKIATIQKLQTKYKASIHDILYRYLQEHDEFEISPVKLDRNIKEIPNYLIRKKKRSR